MSAYAVYSNKPFVVKAGTLKRKRKKDTLLGTQYAVVKTKFDTV